MPKDKLPEVEDEATPDAAPETADELQAETGEAPEGEGEPTAVEETEEEELDAGRFMARASEDFITGPGTLIVDLRDAMLDQVKAMPKPWQQLSGYAQRDVANALEESSRVFITALAHMLSDRGFRSVAAKFVEFKVKGGMAEGKFKVSLHDYEALGILGEAVDGDVQIVIADAEEFAVRRAPRIDVDEPELPLSEATEEAIAEMEGRSVADLTAEADAALEQLEAADEPPAEAEPATEPAE